jgi:membrane protein insertase Oxa1/YidC/SpoIIIJ
MKDTKELFVAKTIPRIFIREMKKISNLWWRKSNVKVDEMVEQKGEEVMKVILKYQTMVNGELFNLYCYIYFMNPFMLIVSEVLYRPVFNIIVMFLGLFGGNLGRAIICMTIVVRLLLIKPSLAGRTDATIYVRFTA